LHCNLLWMTSPKADLHTPKEERFNHAALVPQFVPRIPCYRADLNERLGLVVERNLPFAQWANHLQIAYFGQRNILDWTLQEDGGNPPHLPNAFRNPLAQITLAVPDEPADDPDRGPDSARHKPWSTTGKGSTRFDWVAADDSLQWAAFRRLVTLLRSRGNEVFVVVGPFNEHLMASENLPAFRQLRSAIEEWLTANDVPHVLPPALPSLLYADASHPLTEGYALLARNLVATPALRTWLAPR
ncbi:MAG: SGNH/GDSL hydrolase family protein, partial [Verrucomicrobiae bacterium]|nr:SGNH/GDSL hydrolase family protein [Verrucomicrobiae bacterium]